MQVSFFSQPCPPVAHGEKLPPPSREQVIQSRLPLFTSVLEVPPPGAVWKGQTTGKATPPSEEKPILLAEGCFQPQAAWKKQQTKSLLYRERRPKGSGC